MRLLLLPLLCLLSTAIASASPQNKGPPPGKGPGGPGKGPGGPAKGPGGPGKGPGGPGKGPGGPGGEPPIEKYLSRVTNSLTRLDNSLKSVPHGGSIQEAQRITGDLLKLQGTIVSDLHEGTREIRSWAGPPLPKAAMISSSLVTTGQKLTSAMMGWVTQKEMVNVSGSKSGLVSQLESFSGALVLFYDGIGAKIGGLNQGAVTTAKNVAKDDIAKAIDVFRW
jgi:hypothetical protein